MQNSNAALPGVPNTPALLLLSRRKVKRRGIIRLHSYPTLRLPKEVGRIGCRKKEKNEVRLLNIVTGIKIRELWMLRSIYLLEIDWIYNWIANSCNIHTIWFCLLEKIKNKKKYLRHTPDTKHLFISHRHAIRDLHKFYLFTVTKFITSESNLTCFLIFVLSYAIKVFVGTF